MLEDHDFERALVVIAHPDDVDFGAAGTVATWVESGVEVSYCVVTDGDAGGFDPSIPRREIPALRRGEQTAAAKAVGVTDLHFLGYPDGRLEPTIPLRRDLSRVIRLVRPQRVITQSPDRNYLRIQASHPDHLATGEATLCAVYPDARNPFAHPELADLEPHTVAEVWLMTIGSPTRTVDITDVFERKLAALRCHESQLPDPSVVDGLLRGWGSAVAKAAGLPEDRLAEGFQVIATG